MTTLLEWARDVLASFDTDAEAVAVAKWGDNRYREMVSRVKFRHLRKVGELSLPGIYDTGTVTLTRGSTAVAGSSTQFQTDIGSGTQEYYFFHALVAWYKIASVTNETTAVLESAFAEDDVSGGAYKIAKRYHALASDARWIGDFYFTRLRKRLGTPPLDGLGIHSPGRTLAGNIPQYVSEVGVDSNGYRMVEVYPPPVNSELLHYIYWAIPTTLTLSSTIPTVIEPHTLKEGVLIDLYRHEMVKQLRLGNVEAAVVFRNEQRTQMGTWEKAIKEAIRTSRGADDMTLILEMFPMHVRDTEQRTARDYVFDNWSR